jgi:hypothetical protein
MVDRIAYQSATMDTNTAMQLARLALNLDSKFHGTSEIAQDSADRVAEGRAAHAFTEAPTKLHGKGNAMKRFPPPAPAPIDLAAPSMPIKSLYSGATTSYPPTAVVPAAVCAHCDPPFLSSISTTRKEPPPMLLYIDNYLLRHAAEFNKPPHPTICCLLCPHPPLTPPVPSTFLPLHPCGHWIHYRCLIHHITRISSGNNECPYCHTQLFIWDGITALTLATRTNLTMDSRDIRLGYLCHDTGLKVWTDAQEYEADCAVIEAIIKESYNGYFTKQERDGGYDAYLDYECGILSNDGEGTRNSYQVERVQNGRFLPGPSDGSPNLVAIFYAAMRRLAGMKRPKGRWLSWQNDIGYLLFGSLVGIKLARLVQEFQAEFLGSEGWREFEQGRKVLMDRIQRREEGWTG